MAIQLCQQCGAKLAPAEGSASPLCSRCRRGDLTPVNLGPADERVDLVAEMQHHAEERGWSKAEVARRLETSQSYGLRVLNGDKQPSLRLQARMAVLLGYTYAEAGLSDQLRREVLDADDLVRVGRIIRLSERLRNAGQATEAKRELGPTLTELYRAEAAGQRDDDFKLTLLDGLIAYTVVTGDLSSEEETTKTVAIARRGVAVARDVDDEAGLAHALNTLGNQQRIGGDLDGAFATVRTAAGLRRGAADRCYSAITLARIASERGDVAGFRRATRLAWTNLENVDRPTAVINPLSIGEIEVRGLLALGKSDEAGRRLAEVRGYSATTVAPQWQIILSITAGEIALAQGDEDGGLKLLTEAADAATRQFLPHQLQRIERALTRTPSEDARALRHMIRQAITRGDQGIV